MIGAGKGQYLRMITKRRKPRRLRPLLLVTISSGLLLTGCASTYPEFTTPIEWGNGSLYTFDDEGQHEGDFVGSVRLLGEGKAVISGFPQGTSATDEDGQVCFEPSPGGLYSGQATWSAVTSHRFSLTFNDSQIEVSAGPARFGSQNWSEIRFVECGARGSEWWLFINCGNEGSVSHSAVVDCRPDWP